MHFTIQQKIGVLLILVTTLTLSCFGVYEYLSIKRNTTQELNQLADFEIQQFAEQLIFPLWDVDDELINKLISSKMLDKRIFAVRVKSPHAVFGKMRTADWKISDIKGEIRLDSIIRKTDITYQSRKIGELEIFVTKKFMIEALKKATLKLLVTIISLNILILLFLLFALRWMIIRPIIALRDAMRKIGEGDLERRVSISSQDEIGYLAQTFNTMAAHLVQAVAEQEKLAVLENEMNLARRIQTSLLPTNIGQIHQDFDIAALMETADEVGGDFYDIDFDRNGFMYVAIGDVSGHGVTPGLIMMMAQTVHATVTTNLDCSCQSLVVKINEILFRNVNQRLQEKHFMTFVVLKYLGEGRFEHAGAHLSLIVFRKETGECERIRTQGVYLNLKKDVSKAFKNAYFDLNPGDVLILYTDGLTEATNDQDELLDIDRFIEIIKAHVDQTPEKMKDRILADVLDWSNGCKDDDMTLVILKRKET